MMRVSPLLVAVMLSACARPGSIAMLGGQTMGTTYSVQYASAEWGSASAQMQISKAIEGKLAEINQSMSTYIPSSIISQINVSNDIQQWHAVDLHFETVLRRSREIYSDTSHAFNPAVGPLVNEWGFGPDAPEVLPDTATVEGLLKLADFDSFEFRQSPPALRKHSAAARLDFSAIAKGYGVDALASLLDQRGVTDYVVEIGGEVRASGQRPDASAWRVGIAKPSEGAAGPSSIQMVIELRDAGLATSGTYRNYDIQDGKKIAHIIDPKTGYPAQNSLLSVSVIARDAMTADAYATALIVMGLDEGLRFIDARKGLAAYFVATDDSGKLVERRSSAFPAPVND